MRSYTPTTMPQSLADFDSQYISSSRRKAVSFLPTSKASKQRHTQTCINFAPQHSSHRNEDALLHPHHHRNESSASAATSEATSRSSTGNSMASHPGHGPISIREASQKAQEIQPTSDVAIWAHQIHVTQGRSHWWCQGCFPPEIAEPLPIPKAVEKAVTGRRVRIQEPDHCYGL